MKRVPHFATLVQNSLASSHSPSPALKPSTFAASLELARQGKLQLNQSQTFAQIYVRARQEDTADG